VVRNTGKGALLTMEAFIAAMLVLITVFFLYSDPVGSPSFNEDEIGRRLDNCLVELDISSDIRDLSNIDEESPFEQEFSECLPIGVEHEVVVCDEYGCDEFDPPEDRAVVGSRYFVGGPSEDFPKKIVVYGWSV